eukprot:Platyproteum_vivax@DN3809_c0_g1_i1.p1
MRNSSSNVSSARGEGEGQVHFYSQYLDFVSLSDIECKELIVGKGQTKFVVPKSVLQKCSPVFKAMLQGPFIESTTEHKQIVLSEDCPDAFEKILQLIPNYPQRLQFEFLFGDSLYNLIEVWQCAHKYDFQGVCDLLLEYAGDAPTSAIRNGGVIDANTILRPYVIWSDRALMDFAGTYTMVNVQSSITVVEEYHGDLSTFEPSSLRRLSSIMLKRLIELNNNHQRDRLIQQQFQASAPFPVQSYGNSLNTARHFVISNDNMPRSATAVPLPNQAIF